MIKRKRLFWVAGASLAALIIISLLLWQWRAHKSTPNSDQAALTNVFKAIGKDGTIDKTTALQAYSLIFEKMPGVKVPAGKITKLNDATGPLRWVRAHQNELSPAQKQVLNKRLNLNGEALKPAKLGTAQITLAGAEIATETTGKQMLQIATDSEQNLRSKLGHPGLPWDLKTVDDPKPNEDTYVGYVDVLDQNGDTTGVPYFCHIYIAKSQLSEPIAELTNTIDHEMFHCFQAAQFASANQFNKAPSWLIEGSAEWVGDLLTNTSDAKWWKPYLTEPETPLFQRTYDAIGFYAHLQESGETPWVHFDEMYAAQQAQGNLAAFDKALASHSDSFLKTWATGLARNPSLGPEWDTTGPGISTDKMSPAQIDIGDGGKGGETLSGVANSTYDLGLSAEVVIFDTPQYSKLHSLSTGGAVIDSPHGAYCTKSGGCTCPAGSNHDGEALPSLSAGGYLLAVSGARTGSNWSATGMTLDDYCKTDRVEACLIGTWIEQTMDPPLDTKGLFDFPNPIGLRYDINKNGTYTIDFASLLTITTKGPSPSTIKFTGTATGKIMASSGVAQAVAPTDFSGVTEQLTADGITFPPINVGALFSGFGWGNVTSSVHYTCKGNNLTVFSADRTFTLKRP